jgi:Secretion system C-terminal sorting domain
MRNFTKPILILLFTHILFSINAQIVSRADGDWNDPNTWVDNNMPQSANDVTINHAVTLNGIAVCKDIMVDNGGSLNCLGSTMLTIGSNPNGGNNSMIVEGALTMNSGCQIVLRGRAAFGMNSTWTMSGGTLEIDGNDGILLPMITNSVEDGTPLISLAATSTKVISGGTIRFIDPHYYVGLDNYLISGNANISATVEIGKGNVTATDTPFAFGDDITFSDVNVNYVRGSSNIISFGLKNHVTGNFSMTDGLLYSNSNVKFEGNITCISPAAVDGEIVCMGSPTTIAGNGDFTMATLQSSIPSASGTILVANNIRVGHLMLNNSIELIDDATLWVVDDISGSGSVILNEGCFLKRTIPMGTTALFPVSRSINSGDYAPVTISNTSAPSNWTVSLSSTINTSPPNTKKVLMQWDITPITSSTQANITVQWDNANEESGFSHSTSALYHWNGASWDKIMVDGSITTAGTTHSITKTSWSNFSPFAVFSQASLPVELVSFTGKTKQGKALLTWATASEKNNAGFDIEKSFDGKNFDKIAFVKGNGISTITQNYNFTDNNFTQNAYYRLKQVDIDGTFDYSKTIALNTEGSKNKSVIKSYPNPVSDLLTVETSVAETSQLEIIDAVGRVVFKQNVESGNYQISTTDLVKGMYIVRLSNKNDISIQKIIKN